MKPFERQIRAQGFRAVAGLDEAGRGPLAGPVVAAAVILPPQGRWRGINDSKLLSAPEREKAYGLLTEKASGMGVGIVDVAEIDRRNIFWASLRAMELAVQDLPDLPDYLLIDGSHGLSLSLPQQAIPHGDRLCLSIAAASIVAKVTRDRLMQEYHRQFPQYNFAQNKGYGTREHLEALLQHGCCPLHRRSFRRIHQPSLL
ncbi:MAG: ribonuclease HII [Deltaproteobacteria bacterium]|nr:ribonuclease HII [Deltaproteobacteria bacterium]